MRLSVNSAAIAAAQAILSRGGQPVPIDGIAGPRTSKAYAASAPSIRESIAKVVAAVSGGDASALFKETPTERTDREAMRDLISQTAQQYGVPPTTALTIAWLESRFNPDARSRTGAKGLFQLTSIAVRDVKVRGEPRIDATGKEFDPGVNAAAGVSYIKLVARDLGVPLTDAYRVYMGFNIGPTAAKQVLAGTPELAAAQISNQAYGAPLVYADNLRKAVERVRV